MFFFGLFLAAKRNLGFGEKRKSSGLVGVSTMEEEDEEILSSSDCDDSSDNYSEESQESEGEIENPECEVLAAVSPSSDADRKSKNVNDLLRCVIEVSRFQFEFEPEHDICLVRLRLFIIWSFCSSNLGVLQGISCSRVRLTPFYSIF